MRFESDKTGELGFEPRRTESKSGVLPLHYNPIVNFDKSKFGSVKIRDKCFSPKWFFVLF